MAENPEITDPKTQRQPTEAEKYAASQNQQLVDKFIASLGANAPRPSAVTAPPDQFWIAYFDTAGQLQFRQNESYDPKAVNTTVYGSADGGYFKVDRDGNAIPVREPNADALIEKAVDRQIKEADRDARARNEATTGYHVTDAERAKIENDLRQQGLDQQRIDNELRRISNDQKNKDREEARLAETAKANIAKSAAEVGLIGAQTGKTGAETAQIEKTTELLGGKTAADIKESEARADLAAAEAAEKRRKGEQPTVLTQGVEGPTIFTQEPGGKVTSQMRPGYVPTSLADVQARQGQVLAAGKAKYEELFGKIGANYTREQADRDFNAWYDQNIQPEIATLAAAQEDLYQKRGIEQATSRTAALTAAKGVGDLAIDAYKAQAPRRIGPGGAAMVNASLNAINRASGRPDIDYSSLVTRGPNLQATVEQATSKALQGLSPMAAANTGAPMPDFQAQNPRDVLARSAFAPQQQAAPPPPPVAAPQTGQTGGVTINVQGGSQQPVATPPPPPPARPLLPPGVVGTNLDPNLPAGSPVIGTPMTRWPVPTSWTQRMPNFGNPRMPWDKTTYRPQAS